MVTGYNLSDKLGHSELIQIYIDITRYMIDKWIDRKFDGD